MTATPSRAERIKPPEGCRSQATEPVLQVRSLQECSNRFSKTKQKTQGDLNSLLEGYKTKTYILSHCATLPIVHDAAHF